MRHVSHGCLPEALHEQINRGVHDHKLAQLPPILAFQSVMDSTVSTRAVVSGLFDQLPANGSELVVFDINQSREFPSTVQAIITDGGG